MTDLVLVELRRALARRMTRALAIAAVAGLLLAGILTATNSHRRTPGSEVQLQPSMNDCVLTPEGPPGAPQSQERIEFCSQMAQSSFPRREFSLTEIGGRLQGSAGMVGVAMWVLAASLIGAEWRAGTITTSLTWEPRRARLLASKLIASLILAMLAYLAIQVIFSLEMWLVAATRGSTAGFDAAEVRRALASFGRGAGFVAIMTAFGSALGNLGRNTGAAIGVGFFYTAIIENVMQATWKTIRPWLFTPNVAALVSGQKFSLDSESSFHGPLTAGITLGVYALAITAASFAVFQRRDVA